MNLNKKRIAKIPSKYRKDIEAKLSEISSQIAAARQKRSLSQEKLAEKLDVSVMTIQFIEQGRRFPSLPTLLYICKFLEIRIVIE